MAFQPQSFEQAQPQPQCPTFGYCDSYFVESHDDDDGVYARAAIERDRQRGIAKLRQRALAEELSHATADEYQKDILSHMEHMEIETMPDIQSIEIQTEIQWFMRPYLLDFLLEAHYAFQLLPETLHLTVNLLDRYCSRRVVYKRHYQLVGCASLLIAAKYGDKKERVPTIRELKSMCCSLYDDDMFTQMEWHVLQTLNWIIGHPTVTSFQQLAQSEVALDSELEHMSWYLTELALYHKEFIPVRPSVMARSSLALARCIMNRPRPHFDQWSAHYDPQVVLNLSSHLNQPSQALLRKYAAPHLSSVSTTIELFLARQVAVSQRVVLTPTIAVPSIDIEDQQPSGMYLTPQTPQKVGFQNVHGILTPPITPDKDYYDQGDHPATQSLGTRVPPPCTPTPPPSVEHHQKMDYLPNPYEYHHMPQPQFVH